jgi:large subunit ribosomal protein L25
MTEQGDSSTENKNGQSEQIRFQLKTEPRSPNGSAKARGMRKQGLIPAVAYETGKEAVPFALDERSFKQLASRALSSQVFTFDSAVAEVAGRKALVKEVQRDGIKGDVLHVDFLLLEEGRSATVIVPVVVQGEAPGVKRQGGVLATSCREVTVLASPENVPNEIVVDVSKLALGDRIRTRDVELPAGVTLKSSPDQTVAIVLASRASKTEESAVKATGAAAA